MRYGSVFSVNAFPPAGQISHVNLLALWQFATFVLRLSDGARHVPRSSLAARDSQGRRPTPLGYVQKLIS